MSRRRKGCWPRSRPCADKSTTHNPCGSGLAREGGVSATDLLADPPPSRASPLPHKPALHTGEGVSAFFEPQADRHAIGRPETRLLDR
ncbi:MAG TPA: hypothetical protein DIW86_06135 [Pseudomonas sp.]|nr:hypothetical protein [Pseudomonas sp.]